MIVVVFADLNYSQFAKKEKRMLSEHLQGVVIGSIRKQSLPQNRKFNCTPTGCYRARLTLHEGYLSVDGGPQSSLKTT